MLRSPIRSAIRSPIVSVFEPKKFVAPVIPSGNWLLVSGAWDDSGQWDDAETWKDE